MCSLLCLLFHQLSEQMLIESFDIHNKPDILDTMDVNKLRYNYHLSQLKQKDKIWTAPNHPSNNVRDCYTKQPFSNKGNYISPFFKIKTIIKLHLTVILIGTSRQTKASISKDKRMITVD